MRKAGVFLVLLVLLGGAAYLLIASGRIANPFKKKPVTSLGEQIYTQTQNPIENKIPQTNPFSKVNPFKGVYKNPFQ